jgi:hypothetical protein
MRKALASILSVLCLVGCANYATVGQKPAGPSSAAPSSEHQPSPVPTVSEPLSGAELKELVMEVNETAMKGGSLPDSILRKLKPVEVYNHLGNCVIALQRNAQEERGYYVVALVSSYRPFRDEGGWTWNQVKSPALEGFFSDSVYEYCRKR